MVTGETAHAVPVTCDTLVNAPRHAAQLLFSSVLHFYKILFQNDPFRILRVFDYFLNHAQAFDCFYGGILPELSNKIPENIK